MAHRVHTRITKETRDVLHRGVAVRLDGRKALDIGGQSKGVELVLESWGRRSHGWRVGCGSSEKSGGAYWDKDPVEKQDGFVRNSQRGPRMMDDEDKGLVKEDQAGMS